MGHAAVVAKVHPMVFTVLFALSCLSSTFCEKMDSDEERVLKSILMNYDKEVPPIDAHHQTTTVNISLTLIQIISLNEKKEEMATTAYMFFTWFDDRLKYDASQFGGVNVSRIPVDDLWVPDVILQNSKDKDKFDFSLQTDVLVYDTGKMEWLPPALFSSSCEINVGQNLIESFMKQSIGAPSFFQVELFPFDWQNCSMIFRSPSMTSDELTLLSSLSCLYIDKKVFVANGEWRLIDEPAREMKTIRGGIQYDEVTFYFILQRHPQFYIMNLIVPCILMMTFSCFTFFLPAVSGEKMTLSVSTLLGETVFLFLIAQRMPETSRSVPLIAIYLIFSMALIISCVVFSVIVCNVHYRSSATHRMPHWIRIYVLGHLARYLKMERPPPSSPWQLAYERRKTRLAEMEKENLNKDKSAWKSPSEALFDNQAKRFGFRQRHIKNQTTGFIDIVPSADVAFKPDTIPAALLHVPNPYKEAVNGINYMVEAVKCEEIRGQSTDDWQYCAAILDRLFFWIYVSVYALGTLGFVVRVMSATYPIREYCITEDS